MTIANNEWQLQITNADCLQNIFNKTRETNQIVQTKCAQFICMLTISYGIYIIILRSPTAPPFVIVRSRRPRDTPLASFVLEPIWCATKRTSILSLNNNIYSEGIWIYVVDWYREAIQRRQSTHDIKAVPAKPGVHVHERGIKRLLDTNKPTLTMAIIIAVRSLRNNQEMWCRCRGSEGISTPRRWQPFVEAREESRMEMLSSRTDVIFQVSAHIIIRFYAISLRNYQDTCNSNGIPCLGNSEKRL